MFKWELKDVIMVGIASLVFGVIYIGAVQLGVLLGTLLTPLGLSVLANEFIFGVWFMAAAFAGYILRKPGAATITEMIAALLEVFMGNFYGPIIFVSGFVQGIGTEAGFAATRYHKFGWSSLIIGAVGATITSFIWGIVRSDFVDLKWQLLLAIFVIRLLSALLFSAVAVKLICDHLNTMGILNSYPIAQNNHSKQASGV
ncbi:ECF transporter S component [Loigolactobacillus binensis]|uniref:ECF transporter S component n=1 Tax=Loigolactobacillus binensis TaxID=2559922 RepID=A0ABW3EGK1_9LACO|nr:ECF transporter S component [Loigolactobacillus binensis]